MRIQTLFSVLLITSIGCSHKASMLRGPMPLEQAMKLIDSRPGWTDLPAIDVPRHPAEKFLKGLTVVVDPGHGGDAWKANWKRGPTREREAEMNLRVALLLKRLLKDADCNAILTRESDTDLDLDERAAMANSAVRGDGGIGADLFISIHHNAGGGAGTNYTSVWYHGSVDNNEPDLDVARYVAHALNRHIRTQVAKTSPIFSSYLMYSGGFGVLRNCQVPAILCECSFFSDPAEEQRLRDAGYNLREAYAIYEGLCEWAYCGRPTQTMPKVDGLGVTMTLSEGLPRWWGTELNRIPQSTITVALDDQRLAISYDWQTKKLATTLPSDVTSGDHVLTIHHANMFKNHNWPQRYSLHVNKGEQVTKSWVTEALPAVRTERPATAPSTQATPRPAGRRSRMTPSTRRSG